MGKKRNAPKDEEPPEYATENEKKKTRSANYSQLSTETLLVKEQEATQDLVKLQTELERMRTNIGIHYRSDPLRQMNTKRYRAEYALGEIKAEIQRRARRKMGQDMPKEGIHSGSMSGVIATTTSNTSHAKTRQDHTQAASVLADSLKRERESQEAARHNRSFGMSSSSSMARRPDAGGEAPSLPTKSVFPFPCPSTNSAINTMAMMNAMGPGTPTPQADMMNAMGAGMPTPQEMAAAASQFQSMFQAMQSMANGGQANSGQANFGGQSGLGQAMPKAFANRAGARPGGAGGVPAGIMKKFQKG